MNGARSTFMRKGYWLTALAAIVLLAASPGTAQAQLTATDDFGEGGVKVEAPESVTEGNSATITVSASADVAGNATNRTVTVVVELGTNGDATNEAQDASFNPGGTTTTVTLVFPANGDNADPVPAPKSGEVVSKTISLQTTHDPDAEDENVVLDVTVSGDLTSTIDDIDLEIDDDETQTYVFKVTTDKPKEGNPINVTLRADPAHVNDDLELTLHSSDPKYGHDQTTFVTIHAQTPQAGAPIVVTPPDNDGNRVEDSFTLTAYSGAVGNSMERASVTIDVADINALPAVEAMVVDKDGKALDPQPTSVPEGESVMVAVMSVDDDGDAMEAAEKLTVALRPTGTADAADYTLVGAFTIETDETMSNRVELEVRADEDVGMESLMFDAVVSGDSMTGTETSMSSGVLSLYIGDGTATKINTKDEADAYPKIRAAIGKDPTNTEMNPGDTATIMTSDLFEVIPGYEASYGVSVDSDSLSASASRSSITIDAKSATGAVPAKVTVTGTARMSSSFAPSQSVSNVAELTFEVTVVDTTLVVTLSADPMEIDEGGTSMITAEANRYVTAGDGAVAIALTVVGEGTLDANSITIAMGDMSGSAVLTSTEDDEDFEDETVTVVATGSGIDGTMQVAVAVTDNDEAPPIPNQISAKPQAEAYPVITAAIAAGAGDDEMLTPGESVELMASDLFTVMDGYTASYRVSVDGTAVSGSASGDSISVMAGAAGEAKVTITGTAKMAVSSFEASQDATNVASITFPVMVEAEPVVPEPVPALPLIAQWLLGLGLMGGGARQLFRRRRQG